MNNMIVLYKKKQTKKIRKKIEKMYIKTKIKSNRTKNQNSSRHQLSKTRDSVSTKTV